MLFASSASPGTTTNPYHTREFFKKTSILLGESEMRLQSKFPVCLKRFLSSVSPTPPQGVSSVNFKALKRLPSSPPKPDPKRRKLLLKALSWHSYWILFLDTLARWSCLALLLDTLAWHSLLDTLSWHSCWTLLLDIFFSLSPHQAHYTSVKFFSSSSVRDRWIAVA